MTARHTYTLERMPIEPCERFPDGVPGCTLTAHRNEAEAIFYGEQVADDHPGLTYATQMVVLQ